MANLGMVYQFSVRPSGNISADNRFLGSIDGNLTTFAEVGPSVLKEVRYLEEIDGLEGKQPTVSFKAEIQTSQPDSFAAIFRHHEFGACGELHRYDQGDSTPFNEQDNQQVDLAVFISAPASKSVGFMALQVSNRRSVKKGLESEVSRILQERFNLKLCVKPVIPVDAVEHAVANGLGSVTFRNLRAPGARYDNDSEWWAEDGDLAKAELTLKPARKKKLLAGKVADYIKTVVSGDMAEQQMEFARLATFNERKYEEVAVELDLMGRPKKLRITPEGFSFSHAFSWELGDSVSGPEETVAALAELVPS